MRRSIRSPVLPRRGRRRGQVAAHTGARPVLSGLAAQFILQRQNRDDLPGGGIYGVDRGHRVLGVRVAQRRDQPAFLRGSGRATDDGTAIGGLQGGCQRDQGLIVVIAAVVSVGGGRRDHHREGGVLAGLAAGGDVPGLLEAVQDGTAGGVLPTGFRGVRGDEGAGEYRARLRVGARVSRELAAVALEL